MSCPFPLSACLSIKQAYGSSESYDNGCASHYAYSNLQGSGTNTLNRQAWDPFYLMGQFCVPPLKDQDKVYRQGTQAYKLVENFSPSCPGAKGTYSLASNAWGQYHRYHSHQPTPP